MRQERIIAQRFIVAAGCALLFLQGCATVHMDALNAGVPVMMNAKQIDAPYNAVHFWARQDEQFVFLHRLYGGAKPDINAILQKQLRQTPGDAVINLRIHGTTDIGDVVIPILIGIGGIFIFPPLSLFLYEPLLFDLKSYTVEGDIITYKNKQVLPQPVPPQKIDPLTGLPVEEKKKTEFDPETGLPKK
jgi:hypothetical protein